MNEGNNKNELHRKNSSCDCGCIKKGASRRDFLARGTGVLIAAAAASGLKIDDLAALPITATYAMDRQGTECSYSIPQADGVNIDRDNEVILVRFTNHIYAFSLACPHENTALRWRQQDFRFQCPRHESKYQPDGTFISGRATRNMDRFAIRRNGGQVIVDLSKLYRSDQQKPEWDAAILDLP